MATVLIIDDNDDYRYVFHTLLQRHGFDVQEAPSADEAVRAAQEVAPDVIVLDLAMPVMTGWQAMERLKEDPATAGIPVIVLTAERQLAEGGSAGRAGFARCLHKPVELDDVLHAMRAALSDPGPIQA